MMKMGKENRKESIEQRKENIETRVKKQD